MFNPSALRNARTRRGMSRVEVAVEAGLSRSAIISYELGYRTPNINRAAALAAAVRVPLTRLLR